MGGLIGTVSPTKNGLLEARYVRQMFTSFKEEHICRIFKTHPSGYRYFSAYLYMGMFGTNEGLYMLTCNSNDISSTATMVIKTIVSGIKLKVSYKKDADGSISIYATVPTYYNICTEIICGNENAYKIEEVSEDISTYPTVTY